MSSGLKLSLRAEVSELQKATWWMGCLVPLSLSHHSSLSAPQSKFPEVKVSEREMNFLL